MFGLSKRDVKIAFIFTQVELITLDGWVYLIDPHALLSIFGLEANVFLEIGLFVEHLISRLK